MLHVQTTVTYLLLIWNTVTVDAVGHIPRTRAPHLVDHMQSVAFHSSCRIACYKQFCLPARVFCASHQGEHECCGGIGNTPSPDSRPPTLPIPSVPTPPPPDCSKVSTEFCTTVPKHPCCTDPPITPKPPTLICLFGKCSSQTIKLRYPTCKLTNPPVYGTVRLTLRLYCQHINKKHKCCRRSPALPTAPPSRLPPGPDALPNITVTSPKPITPDCFGMSRKSTTFGKGIRRHRGKPGGRFRHHFGTKAGFKEDITADGIDYTGSADIICAIQPSHPCCTGNLITPAPPLLTPEPEVIQVEIGNETVTTTEITMLPVPCEEYSDDLEECRMTPGCAVSCGDRSCRRKSSIPLQCTTDCSSNCEDLCGCKQSGCEYHSPTGNCRPSNIPCRNRHFPQVGECRRAAHHYSLGGELCVNGVEQGNCQIEDTILAVNLGNGEQFKDSRGIPYQADSEVDYKDPAGMRGMAISPKAFGPNEEDSPLYTSVIVGGTGGKDKCVVYEVPLCEDGRYELAIRTLETVHSKPGNRFFNVKFNGQLVFPEVDILSLTERTHSTADLAVNFQVQSQATSLLLSGFDPSVIEDRNADLEFCYSSCNDVKDPAFIVSAFSVVRFPNQVVASDLSQEEANSEGKCQQWNQELCQCKKTGCEYNVEKKNCHEGGQVHTGQFQGQCGVKGKKSSSVVGSKCRRAGVYYADGGVVLRNDKAEGTCNIAETILAVNMNGGGVEDTRGVVYQADSDKLYKDPWGTREARIFNQYLLEETKHCQKLENGRYVKDIPDEEASLYETFIYGNSTKREIGRCISFEVPSSLENDGAYELCLKMVEFLHPEYKFRYFNVRFGGISVLPEFDILEYTQKCSGIDVIIPFDISEGGSQLSILGHSQKKLGDENVSLSFCYGECYLDQTYVDPDYLISAFYIARLSE